MKWLWALFIGLLVIQGQQVLGQDGEDATDEEATIQDEDAATEADETAAQATEDDDSLIQTLKPSDDAEVLVLFTHPTQTKDLPAGSIVKFLVSFHNTGEKDFVVDTLEASFRYPQDYSFYIQNYTAAQIGRTVGASQEASFDYAFMPSENYAGRPLGLSINLRYHDSDERMFESSVFNATVNIIEDESGFNYETGSMYLVFAVVVVLLLLLGQQMLSKVRRKAGVSKKTFHPKIEVGTSKAEVDYEWIPKDVLNHSNKSPGRSPRNRRPPQNRRAGADD